MGFAAEAFPNKPESGAVSWAELSLEDRNKIQADLARFAYKEAHPDAQEEDLESNTVMLWWITSGYAAAFGDRAVPESEETLDVNDPDALLQFLEELGGDRTKH